MTSQHNPIYNLLCLILLCLTQWDHGSQYFLGHGLLQVDVAGQGLSEGHAFGITDWEGRLGLAAGVLGVLTEEESLVKVKLKHLGKLFNVSLTISSVDCRVCSSLVGQTGATKVINDFNSRAAIEALLAKLSDRFDRELLARDIVAHVHVVLRSIITVISQLDARVINDPRESIRVSSPQAGPSAQECFLFLIWRLIRSIHLDELAPDVFLPLVEVVFGRKGFGVADAHIMETTATELLERFVENTTHLVVLLVRRITKAKDCKFHAFERFFSFFLELSFHPFKELARVVAWISLVVGGYAYDNKGLFWELILLKVIKVDHFGVLPANSVCLLIDSIGKLLCCPCLTAKVNSERWCISRGHYSLKLFSTVLGCSLSLCLGLIFA